MAKVAVLNMTGAQVGEVELNDAIFAVEIKDVKVTKVLKLAQKYVVVVENHGDKKVQVEQDKVLSALYNG